MEKDRVYAVAREILKGIEDVSMDRVLLGEQLFLSRHCIRLADGSMNVVATFGEPELQELLRVAQAILARSTPREIH